MRPVRLVLQSRACSLIANLSGENVLEIKIDWTITKVGPNLTTITDDDTYEIMAVGRGSKEECEMALKIYNDGADAVCKSETVQDNKLQDA